MPLPREVELKLEFRRCDLPRLEAALAEVGSEPVSTFLRSDYFDTPGHEIRRADLTLRVRRDGERRIQTVKSDGRESVGLFDRIEWERDIEGDFPVLDIAPRRLVKALADVPVAAIFASNVERKKSLVQTDSAEIEAAIDIGEVRNAVGGEASNSGIIADLAELELELIRGPAAALFDLARRCNAAAPVRLGVLTKSERGYRLLEADAEKSARAEPIALQPAMTTAPAFRTIAWSCLKHFRLNETILLEAADARAASGALHQARVALRRLRSALSLFRSVIADDQFERFRAALRDLAAVLGEARNLDVLLDRTTDPALRERLQAPHADAYAAVRTALESPATHSLMLDFAEWLTLGDWLVNPANVDSRDQPLLPFAADRLQNLRKQLKRRGDGMTDADDETRHEARITAKKLRYASEFFSALYSGGKAGKRRRNFQDKLEKLQSRLGDLNDLATAPQVLASLGIAPAEAPPADRGAMIRDAAAAHAGLIDARRFW
ncbi:inorganic triphosphatase [Polymorphobacter glacialis]|uniref:Inorganic triphosphatase n=1 Tax=Sandarakinorhabdus glacialis TaxID=1614636 RepID=A0A916ZWT0_9SPHN|nr:CHAD domain-containing protein [Polymorphobacter glacialis]GGE17243.1 inorganic triphosphatase [Polymorphobacter glacialis]